MTIEAQYAARENNYWKKYPTFLFDGCANRPVGNNRLAEIPLQVWVLT